MRYKAFMSYSQAADGRLAPAVQSALHRFAKPWYKPRSISVFRDKTSLSVNSALWSSIEKALSESEYFILFASQESAKSKWVQKEIEYWLHHKSSANILIVLTDGHLVWDDDRNDFDWTATTALPKSLVGVYKLEPFYLDLSEIKTRNQVSMRQPEFRNAIAQLSATLHGKPLDEIAGEHIRQHRKTVRLSWSIAVFLAILICSAIFAAYTAHRNREEAKIQDRIAFSRKLSTQASQLRNLSPSNHTRSILLNLEAAKLFSSPEVNRSLLEGLLLQPRISMLLYQDDMVSAVSFSPDGRFLTTGGTEGNITIWNLPSKEKRKTFSLNGSRVWGVALNREANLVAALSSRDEFNWYLQIWDAGSGQQISKGYTMGRLTMPFQLNFIEEGSMLLVSFRKVGDNTNFIAGWDFKKHQWVNWVSKSGFSTFSQNGKRLAGFKGTKVAVVEFYPERYWGDWEFKLSGGWKTQREHEALWEKTFENPIRAVMLDRTGNYLIIFFEDSAALWNIQNDIAVGRQIQVADSIFAIEFDPIRYVFAFSQNRAVRIWDFITGEEILRADHESSITNLSFSANGQILASSAADTGVALWEIPLPNGEYGTLEPNSYAFASYRNRHYMAVGAGSDTIKVIDLLSQNEFMRFSTAQSEKKASSNLMRDYIDKIQSKVRALAFSRDLSYLAAATAKKVFVFKYKDGQYKYFVDFKLNLQNVLGLAFSPDDSQLAVADSHTTVLVDRSSGIEIKRLRYSDEVANPNDWRAPGESQMHNSDLRTIDGVKLTFSTTRKYLMINRFSESKIYLWNLNTGARTAHDRFSLLFPDKEQMITRSDSGFKVINLETDSTIFTIDSTDINNVIIARDGKYAAGSGSNHVSVWENDSGSQVFNRTDIRPIKLDLHSKRDLIAIATGTGEVLIYGLKDANRKSSLDHSIPVKYLTFTSDGENLATVSHDNKLRVWSITDEKLVLEKKIPSFLSNVSDLHFTEDDKFLVAKSSLKAQFWPWKTDILIEESCKRLSRNFSLDEWEDHMTNRPYERTCQTLPVHPSLLEEAKSSAADGNLDRARTIFERVAELDPKAKLEPEIEVTKYHALGAIIKAINFADNGDVEQAAMMIAESQTRCPELKLPIFGWWYLCLSGILKEDPGAGMDGCEQSIASAFSELTKGSSRFYRGIAKAALGDYEPAAEDLQAFVDVISKYTKYLSKSDKIKDLINKLQSGENPFDEQVKSELDKEFEYILEHIPRQIVESVETSDATCTGS